MLCKYLIEEKKNFILCDKMIQNLFFILGCYMVGSDNNEGVFFFNLVKFDW